MDLKTQVDNLTQQLQELNQKFADHTHNNIFSKQINVNNLMGTLKTVTVAPTIKPSGIYDQVQIAKIAGTSYLYIYDIVNSAWLRVTIA